MYITHEYDVDVNEIINSMSEYEKQDMVDELYDEGYVASQLNADNTSMIGTDAQTTSEFELADILFKVWENKKFINNDDIQTLVRLTKKGFY